MKKSMIAIGSVQDVAEKQGQDMAEVFGRVKAVLLVDTSSSMNEEDAVIDGERMSRHEAAELELRRVQAAYPGQCAVISFSSTVEYCPNGIPVRLDELTAMHLALRLVQPLKGSGVRLILISDGEPDDVPVTLDEARKLAPHPIDTIYIGPERSMWGGKDFLRRLSEVAGGRHFVAEAPGLLGAGVIALLEGGKK